MKIVQFIAVALCAGGICACVSSKKDIETTSLKDAFGDKFLIGTALNAEQILGRDTATLAVVKKHFNAVVGENCMKVENIQPQPGVFDFALADKLVEFGEQNHVVVIGHALVWHSQVPDWFFKDSVGNDLTREGLIQRVKNHIYTVVSRYKGRVKGWDVVNEAVMDDGSMRNSKFLQIIGPDYIKLAFQFAHEADPDAELYYNDYSMAAPGRRNTVVAMVKEMKEQGIRIDAIGMQTHVGLDNPNIQEYEKSLEAFAALNVKVMATEFDISVLPFPKQNIGADVSANFEYQQEMNPYINGLPDSVKIAFENRYLAFFELFLKHQKEISRVTLWGTNDAMSWRNNWPISGRTDYPLLFDRDNTPKPLVKKITELPRN